MYLCMYIYIYIHTCIRIQKYTHKTSPHGPQSREKAWGPCRLFPETARRGRGLATSEQKALSPGKPAAGFGKVENPRSRSERQQSGHLFGRANRTDGREFARRPANCRQLGLRFIKQ